MLGFEVEVEEVSDSVEEFNVNRTEEGESNDEDLSEAVEAFGDENEVKVEEIREKIEDFKEGREGDNVDEGSSERASEENKEVGEVGGDRMGEDIGVYNPDEEPEKKKKFNYDFEDFDMY